MHLYRHFWKLVQKNKSGIIIYGVIILLMISIIASSSEVKFGGASDAGSLKERLDISYVDLDGSQLSRGLIDFLSQGNTCSDYGDYAQERINDLVFFSMTSFHFDIPEHFQERIDAGEVLPIEYRTFTPGASFTEHRWGVVMCFVRSRIE